MRIVDFQALFASLSLKSKMITVCLVFTFKHFCGYGWGCLSKFKRCFWLPQNRSNSYKVQKRLTLFHSLSLSLSRALFLSHNWVFDIIFAFFLLKLVYSLNKFSSQKFHTSSATFELVHVILYEIILSKGNFMHFFFKFRRHFLPNIYIFFDLIN